MRIPVSSYEPSRARIPLLGGILGVRCVHRVWIVGDRGVPSVWRTSDIRVRIVFWVAARGGTWRRVLSAADVVSHV